MNEPRFCSLCDCELDEDVDGKTATYCEDCRDADCLEDILDECLNKSMPGLSAADAELAVTNSTRHDCVAWNVGHDQWRVGFDLPQGYSGQYYSKGADDRAKCSWASALWPTKLDRQIAESIYNDHQRGFTLD